MDELWEALANNLRGLSYDDFHSDFVQTLQELDDA